MSQSRPQHPTAPVTAQPAAPTACDRLGQQLLDALTNARWADGTLIVDADPSVLAERVIAPLLRSLTRLDDLPCLYQHQQPGPWDAAGDDAELASRRCFACGTEEIVAIEVLAPARACRPVGWVL